MQGSARGLQGRRKTLPQEQPLPLPTCKANTHHLRPVVAAYTAPRSCQALADSLPRLAEILATALPRSWQRQGLAVGLARACQTTERRLERPAPTLAPCPHEAPACVRAEGIFLANGRGGTDNIQCVNSQPRNLRRLPNARATFQPSRARVGLRPASPHPRPLSEIAGPTRPASVGPRRASPTRPRYHVIGVTIRRESAAVPATPARVGACFAPNRSNEASPLVTRLWVVDRVA